MGKVHHMPRYPRIPISVAAPKKSLNTFHSIKNIQNETRITIISFTFWSEQDNLSSE